MDSTARENDTIRFYCPKPCKTKFNARPSRIVDAPDQDHPYNYFAPCPACGREAPQAPWDKALFASIGKHTGPKTEAGKAASAANLDGHPTPEEAKITRMNAIKHGMSARVAQFYPAKPGKYSQCEGCEYLPTEGCREYNACLKQTELFMRVHAAFESGNTQPLSELVAQTNAGMFALVNNMMFTINADGGPRLKSPEWYSDKDGGFHLARYLKDPALEDAKLEDVDFPDSFYEQIYKLEAHPLLKLLIDYYYKINLTLSDQALTPKQQGETSELQGKIDRDQTQKETMIEYQLRQTKASEALMGFIANAQHRLKHDPVVLEQQELDDDE